MAKSCSLEYNLSSLLEMLLSHNKLASHDLSAKQISTDQGNQSTRAIELFGNMAPPLTLKGQFKRMEFFSLLA